jgi:CRISPR-associated DxTHG motif protein
MARNLFLSFLGTNDYVECNYHPEGRLERSVENVKYVQEALIPLFCSHFSDQDAYVFFLTDLARTTNWENDGQYNRESRQYDKPNRGLYSRLSALGLPGQMVSVPVPEGFSSQEIWAIFERVFAQIQDGDQIFFDITHAFRSLPLLNLALLNYAKALRHIQVHAIFYGAFEKLGPAEKVRQLPLHERHAPVLDLSSIAELQEWAAAAREFVTYGQPDRWNQLAGQSINLALAQSGGGDKTALNLRGINKRIVELAPLIRANRGQALLQFPFGQMEQNLSAFSNSDNFIKPLGPILELVRSKVEPFFRTESIRWLEAVRWCIDHQLIQQGITQLQEGLLTWLCWYFESLAIAPLGYFDHKREEPRGLLSSALSFMPNPPPEGDWKGAIGKSPETGKRVMQSALAQQLAPVYQQLTPLRNDINHGGYVLNNKPANFAKKLEEYYAAIRLIVGNTSVVIPPAPEGLLNLSNHPSANWSEKQIKTAQHQYGPIEDIPFPAILPEWTEAEIDELSSRYLEQIRPRRPAAVHLMGEMTFTYALAQKLKTAGIPCVASTSERQVVDLGEGRKEAQFRFVRFRPYF